MFRSKSYLTKKMPLLIILQLHLYLHVLLGRVPIYQTWKWSNSINKFQISIRGRYLWKEFLTHTEKEIESTSSFKIVVKQKLLSSYNELCHFWKLWKLGLINEKLPFLICDFYMTWCMGFDDKTSMVFCESHSYSEY